MERRQAEGQSHDTFAPVGAKQDQAAEAIEVLTGMPKPRIRSALSTDIDPGLLKRAQSEAERERVGLRTIVERALTLYLNSDGLPPAIGSSIAKTQADVAMLAAQIEPIAAFLATVQYRNSAMARRKTPAPPDDDGEH